ncbi:MAG: GTPase domain-containing protein [Lachnospiraceae bacterium]|nr:GTPase domain-containing protein [Lachnospiraceae bacterium]
MAEKLTTNVLIIGKSGAGKSSLVNYLFDRKIEATGSGAPVTGEGIYCHEYEFDENTTVNIYDTWGLEADKAERWRKLVEGEIKKHDAMSIKDWFHTIIYCINANADRIEDFETDFISDLVSTGNNLLVVLTHCDYASSKTTVEGIRKVLGEKGLADDNIIEACNESKVLLSGRKTERFGREEIWHKIKQSLWNKIVEKIPSDLRREAFAELEKGRRECFATVDRNIGFFTMHSNRKFSKINAGCNEIMNECMVNIRALYTVKINEAIDFYVELYNRFLPENTGDRSASIYKSEKGLEFGMDSKDKFNENMTVLLMEMIPLVNVVVPFMLVGIKRDEYKAEINSCFRKREKALKNDEKALREYLMQWVSEPADKSKEITNE